MNRDEQVLVLAGTIMEQHWEGIYQKSRYTVTTEEALEQAARIVDELAKYPVPQPKLEQP